MVVHFAFIGQVMEQTGSSRQKTLLFQYFDVRLLVLQNLEILYYETDTHQIQTNGVYLVQGTAVLKDGEKPMLSALSVTQLPDVHDLPPMAVEMNSTIIMKSVPRLIEPDSTIYYFEGELNGYNPHTKKQETSQLTFLFDGELPLFKRTTTYLVQPNSVGRVLEVRFEYQLESEHDRAYGHIKLISFTQFTQVASKKSSGSPSSSNTDGPRTLLGKRTLPVTPQKPSTSSSSTPSISLSQQSLGSPNLQSPSVRRSNRESPDTYSSNTPINEIDSTETAMAEIKLSGSSKISSDDKVSIPSTGSTSDPSQPSKKRKVQKTQD